MARFDPNAYPDRLSFEAHARRIRAEEIAQACGAAGAWLDARQHEIRRRLGAFAASVSAHAHPHSPR